MVTKILAKVGNVPDHHAARVGLSRCNHFYDTVMEYKKLIATFFESINEEEEEKKISDELESLPFMLKSSFVYEKLMPALFQGGKVAPTSRRLSRNSRDIGESQNEFISHQVRQVTDYLYYGLFAILTSRLLLINLVHLNFVRLSSKWQPTVRPDANRTEKCALKKDIIDPDPELSKYLEETHDYLSKLGVTLDEMNDMYALSILYMLIVALFLALYSLLEDKECRVYSRATNFFNNPLSERRRICRTINEFFVQLYGAIKDTDMLEALNYRSEIIIPEGVRLIESESPMSWNWNYKDLIGTISVGAESPIEAFEQHRFLCDVLNAKLLCYVSPTNITYEGYKLMKSTAILHLVTVVFCDLMIPLMGIYGVIVFNNERRIDRRLDYLDCELWSPNATMIHDIYMLDPWRSKEHRDMYVTLRGEPTLANKLRTSRVEIYHTFYTADYLHWIEVLLEYSFICVWVSGHLLIFVFNARFISLWAKQVTAQIRACIECMRLSSKRSQEMEADSNSDLDIEKVKPCKDKLNIERALTISYMNFEVLRREYMSFRDYSARSIQLVCALTVMSSILTYLFVSIISNDHVSLVWALNCVFIIFYNSLVSRAVILVEEFHMIYRSINELLAEATRCSMIMSHPMRLWRRQVLAESAISEQFCIDMFGSNLTASSLIATNSYFLALWLFIWRSIRVT